MEYNLQHLRVVAFNDTYELAARKHTMILFVK